MDALILLSLSFQFPSTKLGYRRKKRGATYASFLAQTTYKLAEWVATFSRTTLLKCQNEKFNALQVFWAPFLLLHLGSAEIIAACFLEDGELWLRYSVGLLIQVGISLYAYMRFHGGATVLSYIDIPIFFSGVVKCGERTWILKTSTFKQLFKNSMYSEPPSTVKLPETSMSSRGKGGLISLEDYVRSKADTLELRRLNRAYTLFKMFAPVFEDLRLRIYKELSDIFIHKSGSAEKEFQSVETELGFLYDALYTKTTIFNSFAGFILRSVCLFCSVSAFIALSVVITTGTRRHGYSNGNTATNLHAGIWGHIFGHLCTGSTYIL